MRKDYPKPKNQQGKNQKSSSNVLTRRFSFATLGTLLNKTKGQIKAMFKKTKTNTEGAAPKKAAKNSNGKQNAIIGVLLLLVVLSIAFSSYIVWFGTQGLASKIMLAPQMIFAAVVLVWKFSNNK